MKIVALDSSGLVASVAVLEEDVLVAEYTVNYKKTHSQTLLPMLDEVKRMLELDMSTVDAIAVSAGPGSFTGLRIGSATAKGLGLALSIPIIPVPTLHALAYNAFASRDIICPIMDARRNQVYTGLFDWSDNELRILMDQCPMDIVELCERITQVADGRNVMFIGDGIPVYSETIDKVLTCAHSYAPANMNRQRAASVGVRAMELYRAGVYEKASEHKPEYLRMSQAERERMEKQESENANS